MNSFNVYGQTETQIGGHTPVWLGTVKPIPVGAKFVAIAMDTTVYKAGMPGKYEPNGWFTPIDEAGVDLNECNAYLYNDVCIDESSAGTCAVVMHHPEGLLIERAYPEITEEQIQALQAKIPGVLLVRG